MSHLPADRLMELAEGEPTNSELAHIAGCEDCARERHAYRGLRDAARAEGERVTEPLTDWATLRESLQAEGLLRDRSAALFTGPNRAVPRPVVSRGSGWDARASSWALRAAAALLLVAGGAMAGRASSGASPLPGIATQSTASSTGRDNPLAQNVMSASFSSNEEALLALYRAQQDYERAANFIRNSRPAASEGQPEVYRARLAALDDVMEATRGALDETPADPVINRYYLAALGAREATLRQLQTSLPPGSRVDSF